MQQEQFPQLTLIPSIDPESDALVFKSLFPDYYVNANSDSRFSLLCNNSSVIFVKTSQNTNLPGILFLDEKTTLNSIQSNLCNYEGAPEVKILESPSFLATTTKHIFLALPGGGTLLVVAGSIEPHLLSEWIVSGINISSQGINFIEKSTPDSVDIIKALAFEEPTSPIKISESSITSTPNFPVKDQEISVSQTYNLSTLKSSQNIQDTSRSQLKNGIKVATFPTLNVTLNGNPFPLNSPTPIPFENTLFVGKALILLRPENPAQDDPYWNERLWEKKKRRFILQIQGKFKRQPRGILYAGAEVSEPMKLGLLTKGICNLLLKFLASFAKDLHYSFGNDKENGHIVAPAWNMFQSIIVTPPGEAPPLLGGDLDEPPESMIARANSNQYGMWNITDTFTLSYHSMYVDLPTWQVVKLPFAPSLDLRTFWGKSMLSICIYDIPHQAKGYHLKQHNDYFLSIQLKFNDLESEADGKLDTMPWSVKTRTISVTNLSLLDASESAMNESIDPILEESDDEDYIFFDAEENPTDVDMTLTYSKEDDAPEKTKQLMEVIDEICPMWIDLYFKGKYVMVYAINVNENIPLFRNSSSVVECFQLRDVQEAAGKTWSPRLSSFEKARRVIGQVISSAKENASQSSQIQKLINLGNGMEQSFLNGLTPTLSSKKAKTVKKSSFVGRALSDHHWIEEWMKVTDMQLAFYSPDKVQKANLYLSLQNILSVRKLTVSESPFLPSFSFMEVQTLGQRIYIMLKDEETCDSWVTFLCDLVKKDVCVEANSEISCASDPFLGVDNPSKEFLHKSSMWSCKQRRIMNCRKFVFRYRCSFDPLKQAEDALCKALDAQEESEERNLCDFLDCAATLKDVDVTRLNDTERTTFFLNLYHIMIAHAFLVLGPPDSSLKWITYFNTIAYQCSDEIFSLTELEHNILRAAMHFPSHFVSRFVIPKSQYRFALTTADYRINFALNCGSLSNPPSVMIYRPLTLDDQLNFVCKVYLQCVEVLPVRRNGLIVSMPRICQWYAEDFGDGSINSILKIVVQHLDTNKRQLLMEYWHPSTATFNDVNCKYLPFQFECRNLTLFCDYQDSFQRE